jgi:hypothetical protein
MGKTAGVAFRKLCISAMTWVTAIQGSQAQQQLSPEQVQMIRDTAASICNTVKEAKGQESDVQIQGDVEAKLGGLAGKLANVGGSGKGSLAREEFEGLSRDATATAMQGDRECRERLFDKMFDKLTAPGKQSDEYRPDNVIGRELAGKTVMDVLVDAGVLWILTAAQAPGPVIRNPYGWQNPTKQVRLVKVDSSEKLSSIQVAELPISEGLVYTEGDHVAVFLVYRVGDGTDFANAGSIYTFHKSPFYDVGARTVFDGRNWGGFPMFVDGHLKYFSYEQNAKDEYYWVIDNRPDGIATKQDAMEDWRIQEAKKSAGLMPSNYAGPHQVVDELIDYSDRYLAR